MTLGVYAGRRDGKIGSRLLTHALNVASRDAFVKEAYLHVQTNNFQAFEFYERFGFEKGEVVKNYYKRIEPPDAVILRRDLGASWTERELEGVTFDEDAA
jgi:ribosomal protein S18 acetylase RimI-like enzyme